jgi:Arc/MetJ family transcription regulator
MATNLAIDDQLLAQALKLSGCKTKKETVNQALQEFVQRREQIRLLELFQTVEYDADYDYKHERSKS